VDCVQDRLCQRLEVLVTPLQVIPFFRAPGLINAGTATDYIGQGIDVPIYLWQRMHLRPAAG